MNATTYGLDIAKNVFQLHWVDPTTGEIHRKKLARTKLVEFFANREPGRIAIEACGGAHHWARTLAGLGHQVELLPAHQVRAFVTGNKNDAADARGIWLACQHADVRRVPIKTVEQQAQMSTHRMRSHWIATRTATINTLRGLLYEFGVVLPKGRTAALVWIREHRAALDSQLPAVMQRLLDDQLQALGRIDENIKAMEREIAAVLRASAQAQRLSKVPGIGLLGATAMAATLGDGCAWRGAREFACCIGVTPRHSGTGGKVRIGGITKRGDAYIRTLLINGARNLVSSKKPLPWIAEMLKRRPFNVVTVAVAHKMARMAWAIVAHNQQYDGRWERAAA